MQTIIKLSAAVALLLQPLAHSVEKYPIQLSRAHQVGKNYTISAVASLKRGTDLKVNGNPVDAAPGANEELYSTMDGTQKVLAIDETGKVEKCLLTIKKLTAKSSETENPEEVVKTGTQISINIGTEKVEFKIDGKPVSEKQDKCLSEFFDPRDDSTDDDVLFGTKEKIAVGDSWKIDSKAAAKGFSDHGMSISENGVRGRMKLLGIVNKDGIDCLHIRGEIELVDFSPGLPPELVLDSSSGRLTLEGMFPIDPKLQPQEHAAKMKFSMKALGAAPQPTIDLSSNGLMSKTVKTATAK